MRKLESRLNDSDTEQILPGGKNLRWQMRRRNKGNHFKEMHVHFFSLCPLYICAYVCACVCWQLVIEPPVRWKPEMQITWLWAWPVYILRHATNNTEHHKQKQPTHSMESRQETNKKTITCSDKTHSLLLLQRQDYLREQTQVRFVCSTERGCNEVPVCSFLMKHHY